LNISGIGCSLIDYLYTNINFNDPSIINFLSKKKNDGGLIPGGLVFTGELEKYTGKKIDEILKIITKNKEPKAINLGGPAIVALVNCSQLLNSLKIKVKYYGQMGNDKTAEYIKSILNKTQLDITSYRLIQGVTPSTYVFSDPKYDNNHGERMFVNNLGTSENITIQDIPQDFFDSNILLFGATALLPNIHDNLSILLKKGKKSGSINILTTVYDFRNSKINPDKKWPLGDSDDNYKNIDLLITDYEEALNLSSCSSINKAAGFFIKKHTPAFIITQGVNPVYLYSNGNLFNKINLTTMPVSNYVCSVLKENSNTERDTTGCGDNFAGGVISSTAYQLYKKKSGKIDLPTACAWGISSGGFACFYLGGTYIENKHGEKKEKIQYIFNEYIKQVKSKFKFKHYDFH